jgi:hypothetical protein
MKRHNRIHRHFRGACLSLAVLGVGLSGGLRDASATEPTAEMLPFTGLAERIPPEPEPARSRPARWLGGNVFYRKHVGFEYRRELKLGSYPVELGLQGPLVRKKKRAGLMMEIRF